MKLTKFKLTKKFYIKNKINWTFLFLNKNFKQSHVFAEQIANNLVAKLLDTTSNKKSFDRWVCLTIPAKSATMLPPVGPFLGQHGFNTLTFCNTYNLITKPFPEGLPLKTTIQLFSDKTLLFQIKTPPTSFLLYSAYHKNDNKGVTLIDLLKVILIKKIDLFDLSNLAILHSVLGTLKSLKFKII